MHVYGVLKGLINGATDASGLDVSVINLIRLARRTFLMIKNKVESIYVSHRLMESRFYLKTEVMNNLRR